MILALPLAGLFGVMAYAAYKTVAMPHRNKPSALFRTVISDKLWRDYYEVNH